MNSAEFFTLGTFEAAVAGIVVGGGLALSAAALVGFTVKPKDAASKSAEVLQRYGRRAIFSLIVGLLVGLITQWPVAGISAAVLVFFWNQLFGGGGAERAAMRKVEALAMWTESLRDTIAGAVGLEQAIPSSSRAADPVLRPHLNALMDRLRGRMALAEALQFFADDLDDSAADLVIAALILSARLRGPGLRDVLTALATSAREEVDMRQRIIAQRAGTRRSVQIIAAVVVAFVLGMAIFNRSYVAAYDSGIGQFVLAVVLGLFGVGFFWLRRLAKVEAPSRFLVRSAPSDQVSAPGDLGAGVGVRIGGR
jgi:Flp pilus assembly protein TadB